MRQLMCLYHCIGVKSQESFLFLFSINLLWVCNPVILPYSILIFTNFDWYIYIFELLVKWQQH